MKKVYGWVFCLFLGICFVFGSIPVFNHIFENVDLVVVENKMPSWATEENVTPEKATNAEAVENTSAEQSAQSKTGLLSSSLNILQKINTYVETKESHFITLLEDKSSLYYLFMLASKEWDFLMGQNFMTSNSGTENAEVFILSDGRLVRTTKKFNTDYNIRQFSGFRDELEARGINFIYLDFPHVDLESDPLYATYKDIYTDYTEEMSSEIRNGLRAIGIDVLSIPEEYPPMATDNAEWFLKTDHHWKPEAGLVASGILAKHLNEQYGYSIDLSLFDEENYDFSTKVKAIGSTGKKATTVYCDYEDVTMIRPLYPTDVTVYRDENGFYLKGPVERVLYNFTYLDVKNPYETEGYGVYAWGEEGLYTIHNNLLENGKKILVYRLSFANCMLPYIVSMAEDVVVVNARKNATKIYSIIDREQPDTVIVIFGTISGDGREEYLNFH